LPYPVNAHTEMKQKKEIWGFSIIFMGIAGSQAQGGEKWMSDRLIRLSFKNALLLICVVYTLLTVISSGLGLIQGQITDTHSHIVMRFVVTSLGIGSILLFNLFPKWPTTAIYALHYAVTMGGILVLVWISGFLTELHPNAYRDIFFNFTVVYILIAAVLIGIGQYKKRREEKRMA